ncbi:MAG: NAD(P)-binding protein [Ruminococcaceae bacterium]|nr:NAD(P)-binding protein [Oscillospiraceae bacterium]
MNVVQLDDMALRCIAGQPPICQRACPLDIDVLGMIDKLQSGGVSAAFRLYTRNAVFPAIVCRICEQPCQNVCVRGGLDEAIHLRDLEKSMTDQMTKRPATNYYVPERAGKALVVGGGMAGLACAVKLAQNGFSTTVVEKNDRLGGRLLGFDENVLPRAVLDKELERVTGIPNLEIILGTEVTDLGAFEYDALLIATGENGPRFGCQPGAGAGAHAGGGVFMAGTLLHPQQSPLDSIREGVSLYYALEGYLKIQYVDENPPEADAGTCEFHKDTAGIEPQMPPTPADPESWSKDEAKAEALRCLRCSCQNCTDASDMLCFFKKAPQKTLRDIASTLNKTEITQKIGLRQIMGCTQCGQCTPVCPVDIDFKTIAIESRRMLHHAESLPQAIYAFWLEDMAFSNGEEAAFFFSPPGNAAPKYLFFPGCQLGASDPLYVTGSYGLLNAAFPGEVGIMTHCCGAPAHWAGQPLTHQPALDEIRARWEAMGKPRVILACPSCREIFDQYLPDIETVSLWKLLAEDAFADNLQSIGGSGTVSVFDPCSSSIHPEDQQSVRAVLATAGYALEELPMHSDKARCCGYGGLVISGAPALAEDIAQRNVTLGEQDYVTYCSNCRDSFVSHGKAATHLLDFILRGGQADRLRPPPDLGDRRRNRTAIKTTLLKEIWDVDLTVEKEPYQQLNLKIPGDIMQKMNKQLIHEDNIKKTIFVAEETRSKVLKPDGAFTAHLRQGMITYWVEYAMQDGGFVLQNVYRHRMAIEEKPIREEATS